MNNKQIAEFFVEQHVLQPSQVEDVLSEAELNGKTIEQAMVDGGFVNETGFYQTIANGLDLDFVDLTEREIAPETLRLIPSGLARLHAMLRRAPPDLPFVVDAATLEVRAKLECPGFPIRVKLTPDGALALVSAAKAGEVAVFDARTKELRRRVPMALPHAAGETPPPAAGTQPIGILIPPHGREAYVACAAVDRVAVLDLATLKVARSFTTGSQPDGLAWYAPRG